VVLLPCVPATPTSVRPTAATATTCCHGSRGMPAERAATNSGLSGSTAVRALVTATRSGRGAVVMCAAACSPATTTPTASTAGVYGGGVPAAQDVNSP